MPGLLLNVDHVNIYLFKLPESIFMKKYFFLAAIVSMSISQSLGQWSWKYPIPQGNTISVMQMMGNSGYGAGIYGSLIYTNDKGNNWSNLDSLTSEHFNGLYFLNENLGYLVGNNGTIFKMDPASTWTKIETGTHYALLTVAFADEQTGIFAGYKGLAYTSDGISLTQVNTNTNFDLLDVEFLNTTDAIIVGDSGLILKSTNAGQDWQKINSGVDVPLFKVCFPSVQTGYAVGKKGLILKSVDGGSSWTNVSNSAIESDLFTVHFINDTIGYAGGNYGTIMSTVNGGQNWKYKGILTSGSIYAIQQLDLPTDTTGDTTIACGNFGAIYRTEKSSATPYKWKNITKGNSHSIISMKINGSDKGLAVGGDQFDNKPDILQTIDGGNSWEPLTVDTVKRFLTGINYAGNDRAYICGSGGSVYRQLNGEWKPLITGTANDLYAIDALDSNTVYAAGINGTIIKTISGDTIWQKLVNPTQNNLYAITFINSATGYAVGDAGVVLRIKSGGSVIQKIHQVWTPMYAIHFLNDSLGFMAGFNGNIFKITISNGQETFTNIPSGVTAPLNEIQFPTVSTGFITGDAGTVLKTTDGGNTWYPVYTGTNNSLRTLYFKNSSEGYVAGAGLSILKTTIGGGSVITPGIFENKRPEIPIKIYPNPVSDNTWIEYELQEKSEVCISLFDLSGRELFGLNPEWQSSGKQRLNISVNGLQKGIYLMMLRVNNASYVKKLVVLP